MRHLHNRLTQIIRSALPALLIIFGAVLYSCTDPVESKTEIEIEQSESVKNFEWNEIEGSVHFYAPAEWTAEAEANWIKLSVSKGKSGEAKVLFTLKKNDSIDSRETTITITSLSSKVKVNVKQGGNADAVRIMDPATIENYDKFYCPAKYNDGFSGGPEAMLRSDSKWSWWRMRQSEHFFVFWMPGFGDDPNSSSVPADLRVDIDDLLAKAEQFYTTNVEKLGMVEVGNGKSRLDQYKMQIYLLYQKEWLATGSGYDNMIGALWVNPSTCKPVGATIAHEIGHSFQFQAGADKVMNGEATVTEFGVDGGFRYGYGDYGAGGCAYWEQCAQWQSFQDYPDQAFGYDTQVWLANHHRSFLHENFRYASYWFPYYFTQLHGIGTFAKIWKESKYPEDPIQAYTRLVCNEDLETFYDEYFQYVQHCAFYDFDAVKQYGTASAKNYSTNLLVNDNGNYQVSYENCPGTTGFNLIPLNVVSGEEIEAEFNSVDPSSSLLAGDPGRNLDGDGVLQSTVTSYNKQNNKDASYRFGFVSINSSGVIDYGQMYKGTSGTAKYTVPANTQKLYFAVVGTPTVYLRQAWDDNNTNDEQWPYEVGFKNTDLLGNVDIPKGNPESIEIEHNINLNSGLDTYVLGTLNLLDNGDMAKIAKAFRLQPSQIAAKTLSDDNVLETSPDEGEIVIALTQPDGTLSYDYSANGIGFWCNADGSAGNWGPSAPTYFEYIPNSFSLDYGHRYGVSIAGETYTIKPTIVYKHNGTIYKAVIALNLVF